MAYPFSSLSGPPRSSSIPNRLSEPLPPPAPLSTIAGDRQFESLAARTIAPRHSTDNHHSANWFRRFAVFYPLSLVLSARRDKRVPLRQRMPPFRKAPPSCWPPSDTPPAPCTSPLVQFPLRALKLVNDVR